MATVTIDYGPQLWRHVAVQHACLGNDCLNNGCLGMDRAADGGGRARRRPVTLAKGPRTKFF